MNKNKIVQQLELLFQSEILTSIPQVKDNQIQIKDWIINYKNNLYYITKNNKPVATTYTKAAALAIVKTKLKNDRNEKYILELDKTIEKNQNDCTFYKHTITTVKNKNKRFSTMTRLEIADQILQSSKKELHGLILH